MTAIRRSFCVVCIANYCRSPVAEILLKERFQDSYEFFSAGLSPISLPNMDPRSIEFLKQNNVNHNIHTPKKINIQMLNYFDRFLVADLYVLNQLNKTYPKYQHKFFLLSSQFKDINIFDPFQLETHEYIKIMNDIKFIAERINLELV